MNIQRWIARREPNWRQLDELLKQVEQRGIKSLKASEIGILASLYRSVSADLARARTNNVGNITIQDLQNLTARGYNQIYQGDRQKDKGAVINFYLWGLPMVMQQSWGYIGLAFVIFMLGALVAWWFAWQDPIFMALVVPQELIATVRDRGELWTGSILGNQPLASSGIAVNNLMVSFNAIAGGITFGIFTTYALFYNGLLIGAIAVLVGQNNLAIPFWAFVFPHGALELPAIFMAGGAGLLIARALLLPGQYRRVDALKIYGLQAAQLVYGVIPMLLVAGAIEGFISPNPAIPNLLKYVIGTLLFVLLIIYSQRRAIGSKV
jgi:uncharacterized membrane protein SpoIIM required for sporulation